VLDKGFSSLLSLTKHLNGTRERQSATRFSGPGL
jgi:hypothetical protein